MSTTNDRVIASTARRRPLFRPALVKETAPAAPEPVRRGSYADHAAQFPEMYAAPDATPMPDADATLACLMTLLDQRLSFEAILLVAETRGVGAGVVALELAKRMAAAGIGAR